MASKNIYSKTNKSVYLKNKRIIPLARKSIKSTDVIRTYRGVKPRFELIRRTKTKGYIYKVKTLKGEHTGIVVEVPKS